MNMYCVDDNHVHLMGTKNDEILYNDSSFLIYEISRCNNDLRNMDPLDITCTGNSCETVDPPCASETEIDKWTESKRAMFRIINNKIDINNFSNYIRQSELMFDSIPLGKGYFSDSGYRMRKNVFTRQDNYWPMAGRPTNEFYDYVKYNSETMYDNYKTLDTIGLFYFRISTDKIDHERQVYRFMDWLGDVGGIGDVISFGILLIFGGFLEFNFQISTIESLYS